MIFNNIQVNPYDIRSLRITDSTVSLEVLNADKYRNNTIKEIYATKQEARDRIDLMATLLKQYGLVRLSIGIYIGSRSVRVVEFTKNKITLLFSDGIQINLPGNRNDVNLIESAQKIQGGGSGGGIEEAPEDGKTYGRKDKSWEEITGGTEVSYTNPGAKNTVGGIMKGTQYDKASFQKVIDDLLDDPETSPTLTNPSTTFAMSPYSTFVEVGSAVGITLTTTFNRGSINPAYGTSGNRSGLPNKYNYTGPHISSKDSTSMSDSQTIQMTATIGAMTWTSSVQYDAGEQPLTSRGNPFGTALPSGSTTTKSLTITGVYPYFANTYSIDIMTKQPLASMAGQYIQVELKPEDGTHKQSVELPIDWATITGIQMLNPISNQYEWISGSKAASLLTFDKSQIQRTIQGNVIQYNKFTNNTATVGARSLRFYTT